LIRAARILGGRDQASEYCPWANTGAGDGEFSFDNTYAFQQLFTAVVEVCGLKEKMAATGHVLPDDEGEDA
jgi:hypothetical protein